MDTNALLDVLKRARDLQQTVVDAFIAANSNSFGMEALDSDDNQNLGNGEGRVELLNALIKGVESGELDYLSLVTEM